jgi:hypothetical protein
MKLVIGIDPSFTACGVSDGEQHIVITTKPRDDQDAAANLRRRSSEIVKAINEFIGDRECHIFIEAAMSTSRDAMHLYELGWLMNDLHSDLRTQFGSTRVQMWKSILSVREVPIATLRKWATGKGNAPKDVMKLAVYKKFGVEFDRDPGCDKLFAFLLAQYGRAVLAGDIQEVLKVRRGQGVAAKRRARSTRKGEAAA